MQIFMNPSLDELAFLEQALSLSFYAVYLYWCVFQRWANLEKNFKNIPLKNVQKYPFFKEKIQKYTQFLRKFTKLALP